MTTAMTGLELLRTYGSLPPEQQPANIGNLFDMRFESLEEGAVEMSIATRDDMRNPLGTLHGGAYATLIDSTVGCAVHTTLPAGASYGTLELKINFIRAVQTDGQRITAKGTVIHRGRTTAVAEATAYDAAGRVVAHATTTCIIHPAPQ